MLLYVCVRARACLQVPLIDMAHIVKLGGSLITNALTQQLVIPEFEGFCEELQKYVCA